MEAINTESGENILHYLTPEDKQRCDAVFEIYTSHVSHITDLLKTIETRNEEYEKLNFNDDEQFFSLRNIDKAIEALRDTLETLTQSLILKFEHYFKNKYCLVFKSLIPDKGSINLDPLPSYNSIVANIIEQVGTDLLKAGKEQIKSRFINCFRMNSLPELKGNKFSVPCFVSLDEHFGERISLNYSYNSRLEYLVNALNLFLNDSTELQKDVTGKLLEWKRNLDLSEHYTVFDGVSFKFFKNRRLDVLFTNATTARKLWNYYTLELIEKIIHEKN